MSIAAKSKIPPEAELYRQRTGGDLQVIGTPETMMSGRTPVFRELTLEDITDDCPVCQANRLKIEAGEVLMALVYE